MTLLFRSKSSRLGLDFAPSPPSPSVSAWEGETEDEYEDETEDEECENETEDFDEQIHKFEPYYPISTPFVSSGLSKEEEERESGGGRGSGQFPILAFVVAALRKSLVTCSVERDDTASLDISFPTDVRHVCHVTFDRFNGFLGLPVELQPEVPRKVPSASASVFGVSPKSMQCSIDERGNSVPTILLLMQKHLYQGGGLQAEGIFRINPENSQEEWVRSQLNKGVIPQGMDVHCLAGLIKAWFRELPKGVLDSLTPEQVMHCNSEEECTHLVKQLPPTESALLDWAINLMADVVHNEHYNKMNARNIAMVFAPNMTQMTDPLTALIHAVQVMNLLKTLIVRTLRLRDESDTKSTRMFASYFDSLDTSNKLEPSISTRDSSFQEKQPHSNKLLRSVNLDRSECSPEKKHRKSQEKYKENDDDDEIKHYASSFSGGMSLVSESGGEAETGILDRLNLRKGVKKLYKHPIFKLSKPSRKTAEFQRV